MVWQEAGVKGVSMTVSSGSVVESRLSWSAVGSHAGNKGRAELLGREWCGGKLRGEGRLAVGVVEQCCLARRQGRIHGCRRALGFNDDISEL